MLELMRKYRTNWSTKDCIGFLKRKNIYDVVHYDFYTIHNSYYITFKAPTQILGSYTPDVDLSIDILHINYVYMLIFEENNNETIISVRALDRDIDPHISEQQMDKFFLKKLDAITLVH